MTAPGIWLHKSILQWPVDQEVLSSWILLFGFLPIDRHSFCLQSIDPATGFSERSTSLINRNWIHKREVVGSDSSCRVADTIEFEPRLAFLGRVLKPVYRFVFRYRHRNLRKRFGSRA